MWDKCTLIRYVACYSVGKETVCEFRATGRDVETRS